MASEFDPPPTRRAASAMARPISTRARSARRQQTFSARVSGRRVESRTYSAMKAAGPGLSESFDKPMSGREEWWRTDIKETPNPGTYESQDFLRDLDDRPATYRFRSAIRQCELSRKPTQGPVLLPGAYEQSGFVQKLSQKKATYSFRDTERDDVPKVGHGCPDKHFSISPSQYNIVNYTFNSKLPCKNAAFRSRSERFPSGPFKPVEGPGPGQYSLHSSIGSGPTMSSSFQSRVSRLPSRHTRVPGPGTYTPADQNPMPPTVKSMGHNARIFFKNTEPTASPS